MKTATVVEKQDNAAGRLKISCYYWQMRANTCGVCREGLLLPLSHHICAYCLTDNFTSCPYYHHDLLGQSTVKSRSNSRRMAARRAR